MDLLLILVLMGSVCLGQYSPQQLEGFYGLVQPTNRTHNSFNSFSLSVEGNFTTNIQALTVETDKLAGLNSPAAVSGNLRMIWAGYNGPALDWSNAALINCDNTTDVIDSLNLVLTNNPACTILYSLSSEACYYTRPYRIFSAELGFVFTTVSAKGARDLIHKIQEAPVLLHSVAWVNNTQLPNDDTPVVGGHAPSRDTKIAMAVLYCLCGVIAVVLITLLSLGIWRVHRHPERYGLTPPNHDSESEISDDFNNGGGDVYSPPTRVKKAKGLARAVLDAIPLFRVKRGRAETEAEPQLETKPCSHHKPSDSISRSSCDVSQMETLPVYIQHDDNCAICFEAFEENQIIRQLPCSHRFHAECVDHWLLNSSSQCPMCRMNLRRGGESSTTELSTAAESSDQEAGPPQRENETPPVITVTQRDLNISLATRIVDWWTMSCLPEDARDEARERLNRESELRHKIKQLRRSDGSLMPNDGILATDDGLLRVLLDNRPLRAPPIDTPLSERMMIPGPDLDLHGIAPPVPRYSIMYKSEPSETAVGETPIGETPETPISDSSISESPKDKDISEMSPNSHTH